MNFLLQAKRVLVDSKGLESALEAVRVSVEVVREPAGKIVEQIKTF